MIGPELNKINFNFFRFIIKLFKSYYFMSCHSGAQFSVCLSDDGTVFSFGSNDNGQLGHNETSLLPHPILNLPKIKKISCGSNFTVCVDEEGSMWSFGCNKFGQLGTGNKTNYSIPQKVQNIPAVKEISCGFSHVLFLSEDLNLWSVGHNGFSQLCVEDKEHRINPQQTSFSLISKISAGSYFSFFQTMEGEIFACGFNSSGELGLGSCVSPNKPCLIPNQPPNIIQFCCGTFHSLFLDSDGNVFSTGSNSYGALGYRKNPNNNNQLFLVPGIPPIHKISCVGCSSYLIDFDGNLWCFGQNNYGQLGFGDIVDKFDPEKVNSVKNVHQISIGCSGSHLLLKNSQGEIFVTGSNCFGQIAAGMFPLFKLFVRDTSVNSEMWGADICESKVKSARK